MNFIKNLPISRKLLLGFGSMLLLLLVISVASYMGFGSYREIARDNNLMGRVQANLLSARLSVLRYLRTQDDAAIAQFDERIIATREFVLEADDSIEDPERAERVDTIATDLNNYEAAFRQVIELFRQRDALVALNDDEGREMREKLSQIMDTAYRDGDAEGAYFAGVAQQDLLLARLFMVRYLNTNANDDYYRAFEEITRNLDASLGELRTRLQNPERRRLRDEIEQHADAYAARMSEIYTVILQRNTLIADQLDTIGPKIASDAEWIKLDILEQQDTLGPLINSIIIIMSLVALAFAGVITRVITNAIKVPLDAIVRQAEAMGRGDLSVQSGVKQRDEMGLLADTFSDIQGKLSKLLGETEKLIHSVTNGKLDVRASNSGYEGAYLELVDGVNGLCDAFVAPINVTAEYVDRISKGDIPPRITDDYKGDFNEIKNNLNQAIDVMNGLTNEINRLIGAASNGKLDVRADASSFTGGWGELVNGLNTLVNAFVQPINVTAEYVDRIAKGDIPPRITEEYKGDFNEIKNNLNQAIDVMNGLTTEINRLIGAASNGKLDVRADASSFTGGWQTLVRGLNDLVNAFVQPINVTAEYVDRIAKGDIPPKITEDYKGDFNEIKNNLNQAIDVMNGLLSEVGRVITAAEAGQLDERANANTFTGGWQNLVKGINDVLEAFAIPLDEAGRVVDVMATGDLTARMTRSYQGDLLRFKDNINSLGESLSGLINQVNTSVSSTAASAQTISQTAEGLSVSSKEQAGQSEQISTAVEDMARTITENAMNASKTAELAENSGRIANSGGEVLQQTISKMRDISGVVSESAENIGRLGESSKQIGDIISVIDDIAYQTNLLALNAAIEAARAGEQGRGFAVVADEVRRLAERTGEATKQIADMIKRIQVETRDAVTTMDKGTTEVTEGIRLADKAGESLTEILQSIQAVLERINQIAQASEEQSATSEEISASVTSIYQVARDSAAQVDEVARTADGMAQLTQELSSLMARFRVAQASA